MIMYYNTKLVAIVYRCQRKKKTKSIKYFENKWPILTVAITKSIDHLEKLNTLYNKELDYDYLHEGIWG